MATEKEVFEIIIDPMAALYGRPYGCSDEQQADRAQSEYLKTLRDYPAGALKGGWAEVRRSWKGRTWPPIGVLTDAASRFQRELAVTGSVPADRSRRFAAAIEYMADGTAPPPGLGLPLKQLVAARVGALTKRGLALGKRESVPYPEAETLARRVLEDAA